MTVRFGIRAAQLGAVLALVAGLMVVGTQPAAAHETREVGRFTFVVGFGTEPAYSNIPNSVSLAITETASEEPFVNLEDRLDVHVIYGEETKTMPMSPAFAVGVYGTPGQYTADFVPSRPGQYTFHFQGTVGGVEIDEAFVSGPSTFGDVGDISEASFPVQDPSTGQLAKRLEQETARMEKEIARLDDSGSSSDALARSMSIAALVLSVAALGTSLLLVRRRQP